MKCATSVGRRATGDRRQALSSELPTSTDSPYPLPSTVVPTSVESPYQLHLLVPAPKAGRIFYAASTGVIGHPRILAHEPRADVGTVAEQRHRQRVGRLASLLPLLDERQG